MSLNPSNSLLSPSSGPQAVAMLNRLQGLLASAQSLEEIAGVRSVAEMARSFAKTARLSLEVQNDAAELKLRAEREAGAFLAKHLPHGGARRSRRQAVVLKLEELGISAQQACRWRQQAGVPEHDFEQYLAKMRELEQEVTASGLRRVARSLGKISPRKKSAPPTAPSRQQKPITEMFADLITDLHDHRALLEELLSPLCRRPNDLMRPVEQRHIQRLLTDMKRLLTELAKTVG